LAYCKKHARAAVTVFFIALLLMGFLTVDGYGRAWDDLSEMNILRMTLREYDLLLPFDTSYGQALEEMGIEPTEHADYHAHTARQLTAEIMERADRVFGLTDGHNFAILTAFPEHSGKLCPLGVSVPDPYGGTLDDYMKALGTITEAINQLK